jgi:hypothetical protein
MSWPDNGANRVRYPAARSNGVFWISQMAYILTAGGIQQRGGDRCLITRGPIGLVVFIQR